MPRWNQKKKTRDALCAPNSSSARQNGDRGAIWGCNAEIADLRPTDQVSYSALPRYRRGGRQG